MFGIQTACSFENIDFILSGVGLPPYTLDIAHSDYINTKIQASEADWKICGWNKANFDLRTGSKGKEINLITGFYEYCKESGAIVMTGLENNYARSKLITNLNPITTQQEDLTSIDLLPETTIAFMTGINGDNAEPISIDKHNNINDWASTYSNSDEAVLFITFNYENNPKKAKGEYRKINGDIIDSFEISTGELEIPLPGYILEVKDEQAYIDAFEEIFKKAKETFVVTEECANDPNLCNNQLLCEDAKYIWNENICVQCVEDVHCLKSEICTENLCAEEPTEDNDEETEISGELLFTFAIIGDFGQPGNKEGEVANLVNAWNPEFIVTTGDNTYLELDKTQNVYGHIEQYYGNYYKKDENTNAFFPVMGNHDFFDEGDGYGLTSQRYRNYFYLPNEGEDLERFYDFMKGDLHFFMINSEEISPWGSPDDRQKIWLEGAMKNSEAKFKLVVSHHSPYATPYSVELAKSKSSHGSNTFIQWPFKDWGADIILAGHNHVYERLEVNLPILINGLGGGYKGDSGTPISGSKKIYSENYGAIKALVYENKIIFKFINIENQEIDSFTLNV